MYVRRALVAACRVSVSGELTGGLCDAAVGKGKAVELEDVKFHQCVRLSRFESDRTISFIPPDGEFELMSYRLSTPVKPLIWIEAVIERHTHSRVEYLIKAKGQFKRRSTANNVEIVIPVPSDADTPKFKTTIGVVTYVPSRDAIVWTIRQFAGGKEYMMRAHFGLPSIDREATEGRPPITVKFEIPYFTVSGIQVRYLKIIEKSGYQALPWVRYITQNGGTSSGERARCRRMRVLLTLPRCRGTVGPQSTSCACRREICRAADVCGCLRALAPVFSIRDRCRHRHRHRNRFTVGSNGGYHGR